MRLDERVKLLPGCDSLEWRVFLFAHAIKKYWCGGRLYMCQYLVCVIQEKSETEFRAMKTLFLVICGKYDLTLGDKRHIFA